MNLMLPYWPVFTSFVLLVAWGVRLEAKILYLEKENTDHKDNLVEKDKLLWAKLDAIQVTVMQLLQSVAKMEGRTENKNQQ